MKKILEVKNINKSYQHNKAINNLSFNVYDGEILRLKKFRSNISFISLDKILTVM